MHARAERTEAVTAFGRPPHSTLKAAARAVAALARIANPPVAAALALMRPAVMNPPSGRMLVSDLDAFLPVLDGLRAEMHQTDDGDPETGS